MTHYEAEKSFMDHAIITISALAPVTTEAASYYYEITTAP
jgi:hypothetical protein